MEKENLETPEDLKNGSPVNENNISGIDEKVESDSSDVEKEKGEEKLSENIVEEIKEEDILNELEEMKDKHLRLFSEFENYRRRTSKEKIEIINNASKDLIIELLPVLDDFERAIKAGRSDEASIKGIELIHQKLSSILNVKGLKQIEVQVGDGFDAELHEAITQIPAPKEELKGKVVDIIEKGYYLNTKVIRFAKVVTGSID